MNHKVTAFNPTAPSCVVFDMDNTLCDTDHGNWDSPVEATPRDEMLSLAKRVRSLGYDVVIATARPSFLEDQTLQWLDNHGLEVNGVYHSDGLDLPSSVTKKHMLMDIQKTWKIILFYDDSPYNIMAAAKLGIPVYQVEGNEDFWKRFGNR